MLKEIIPVVQLAALLAIASGFSAGPLPAQESMLKVKGGHELGETAQQFFSEGFEKQALAACTSGDYRGIDKGNKREMKKYCSSLADGRQEALRGKRFDYTGGGDLTEYRTDTFTFDGGHLVKVELVYSAPSAETNYHGQSFEQLFAGMKSAYGPPTNETTKVVRNTYGVEYTAHHELWLSPQAALIVNEQPGENGSTTIDAFTRAEYDRSMAAGAPKPDNPLR
jgi:hypothetical protein